ncbi:30S ribosomal protein S15 [candidate division WOR-1 bacterium RIFCSPHIGHO2_01_FULL_53_15]|uniref:Small ribosomal subunit protein uS15 n=1 Tax=candidate division WOR-1 bacterium RIFCSPHIGHO2_01_FULL_53_15 TaxID=1802564 RepID=A0A1F4Q0B3_UNCSA|nr:MAG: 30S ribosomal protein S15 [candidate division WOR-1 bacterium RIFCSPHIGHO2_01_FULL_53_15]OGC12607.1 MAG: 30S ribosomal protein S15 [candidate division WOR-1 bacterium RIFCSPHIGHO2_02_FULL_53_26]
MVLKKEKKTEVLEKYKRHPGDTGSSEVQIALLTERINTLVDHLKRNKKDQHSRHGLLLMVGQRKRLLKYLQQNDAKKFEAVTTSLDLA